MAKKKELPSSEKEPEPVPESEAKEEEEEDEDEEEEEEESEEEEEEESEEEEEEEEEDEEEEDLTNRENLLKVLEPFGKEQLVDLLKEAAARNPALLARISSSAESDPAHRKIFIHGLSWDCSSETLAAAFRSFGEIEECRAVSDRATGRCKGYGFILFKTRSGARKALKEPHKHIGGRLTACQLASAGTTTPAYDGRKLYVSNIGPNVNPDRLKTFFAKFGEIEEGPLGYDKMTGKLRGFAIFVYKTPEGCRKALEEPVRVFEGCILQCQRALEGGKPKVPVPAPMMPVAASPFPPNDLAMTYAAGSSGLLSPAAGLLGQSGGGVGLLNPAAGISPTLNRGAPGSSFGVGMGVNTVSPSVIGSYQSPAALQGLGAYQSSQAMNPGMRSQSSLGPPGSGLSSYLGR